MDYYTALVIIDKSPAGELEFIMKYLLFAACLVLSLSACSRTPAYREAPLKGDMVAISLDGVMEDRPVFFSFTTDEGRRVNFFLLRKEGEVKSYLDACARCYPRKLGYRAEKGRVVCRACDVGYHNHSLKHGIGSCYPITLQGAVTGGSYTIREEDLRRAARYF